jgi:hypothetical protein
MLSPPTAYDGLYELSNECWRCCASAVYMSSASVPRFPTVGNAPGVLDDIRYFLENLLNQVSGWTISLWIRNTMLPMVMPYIKREWVDPARDFIITLRNYIINAWNSGVGYIQSLLVAISATIGGGIASFRDYIYGRLGSIEGTLSGSLASFRDYISNRLKAVEDALGGGLASFRDYIATHIWSLQVSLNAGIASFRDYINTTIASVRDYLYGRLGSIEGTLSGSFGQVGSYIFLAITSSAASLVNAINNWFDERRFPLPEYMIKVATTNLETCKLMVEGLWSGVTSIPGVYLNWLAAGCGTDLALTPSRAMLNISGLYGMSIMAGTVAHTISTSLNLIPTLNWVGASQFAGLVSQAAAFDPLTKATYGILINEALAIPIRYHWANALRPSQPTVGEIYTMGRKHGLSMAEFRTAMGYQGIPNWWIDKIYDFFWTDPSPMWLLRMTEGGIPTITSPGRKLDWLNLWIKDWRSDPMAWLRMKLMLSGFEDIDIDPMISGMKMRSVTASVTGAKTAARAMMHEAYWTEANAKSFLTPLGVRPEEIHMLAIAEELDYQKSYLDDQVAYYAAAFAKGQISDQDLKLALTTIYVKPERVAQVMAREQVRKLPTPKAVTPVENNPQVTRLRTQAVDSWIKAYRAWEISEDDLLLSLTIIVQDSALARAMVNVEQTRFRPAPPTPKPPAEDPLLAASRRQSIATWITAYRAGTIVAAELELYLEPLIADAALRKQLVALERLRYSPTPDLIARATEDAESAKVRAEYVRGHIEMFEKRLLDLEQLYQYLIADGLAEPLARATVITQATKRIKMPDINSPYYLQAQQAELIDAGLQMYEDAYMAGEITLAQYEAWIATLAKDQDVVAYLADVLALKKFAGSA